MATHHPFASPSPDSMRSVQFDRFGGSDVLAIRAGPIPEPAGDEVLVRVHATGVNPKDAMIRSGAMRILSGRTLPRGTGFDFAGEVVRAGNQVQGLLPGAAVWGFLDGVMGGAAAEYVTVPRRWVALKPEALGWLEAAALPLVASTALQALRDVADLQAGERVLIRGASGGVGSAAIQIARAMGARVTGIASGDGIEHCLALGAHEMIDHGTTNAATEEHAFDVYLDCIGRSPLRRYGRMLSRRGRWVAVAPSPVIYALTPVSRMLSPLLRLPRLGFVVVRPIAADLEELGRLVAHGHLRMPVSETHPLEEIGAAHDGPRTRRGKRVVVVSPEATKEARGSMATAGAAGASGAVSQSHPWAPSAG